MDELYGGGAIWHGGRDKQAIALTFDDCYDYELLCGLENILDQNPEVHITFFPTGIALLNTFSKCQQLWQRFLAKGHEIGYHGYDHAMPSNLGYQQTVADFDNWNMALSMVMSREVSIRFARPPYGDLSQNFLRVCRERNIIPVMWSANWSTSHKTNYKEVEEVQNGDIVIFHIRHQDIESFENILPILQKKAMRAVGLSELLFGQDETVTSEIPRPASEAQQKSLCAYPGSRRDVCIK
ncbi:polysaccharide deacetylase family protein [uncultured Thermanaerothrix sp.]|uniref:polysaccharide deacetylase family protein n=1 Tax=uncultured Thermanaerothrix sp. TaxID=1195149 RepID=UPI0026124330|nr:polysaccharide deacetylase family protein [uncultured Thermanaerothrix sp.]